MLTNKNQDLGYEGRSRVMEQMSDNVFVMRTATQNEQSLIDSANETRPHHMDKSGLPKPDSDFLTNLIAETNYWEGFDEGFAKGVADVLSSQSKETKEIDLLEQTVMEKDAAIESRDNAILFGGSLATGITIAAILGYVKERKVHKQIVALIEETALAVTEQTDQKTLAAAFERMNDHLVNVEVRSFRHPFGVPKKELEHVTDLLIGLMKQCSQLQPAQ